MIVADQQFGVKTKRIIIKSTAMSSIHYLQRREVHLQYYKYIYKFININELNSYVNIRTFFFIFYSKHNLSCFIKGLNESISISLPCFKYSNVRKLQKLKTFLMVFFLHHFYFGFSPNVFTYLVKRSKLD